VAARGARGNYAKAVAVCMHGRAGKPLFLFEEFLARAS